MARRNSRQSANPPLNSQGRFSVLKAQNLKAQKKPTASHNPVAAQEHGLEHSGLPTEADSRVSAICSGAYLGRAPPTPAQGGAEASPR